LVEKPAVLPVRYPPDVKSVGVLLEERNLPAVVTQRGAVAIVGEIEELVARPPPHPVPWGRGWPKAG
jgi:hypothetical protein